MSSVTPPPRPTGVELLTWAGLLGQWLDFARASVALPPGAEGDRWRRSVAPLVNLQAVTFALAEAGRLPERERALARDRAAFVIDRSESELGAIWPSGLPAAAREAVGDARAALRLVRWLGLSELIWPGPGTLIVPALDVPTGAGTLAIMQPGTIVMPREPVAWWLDRPGVAIEGCVATPATRPRQVYRQFDAEGRIDRDVIRCLEDEAVEGLPLLVPLLDRGSPVGHFTLDPYQWLQQQRRSMPAETVPVLDESRGTLDAEHRQ
jgi:hypothetical protein